VVVRRLLDAIVAMGRRAKLGMTTRVRVRPDSWPTSEGGIHR
jgi:hypothetical protein